jgi:glycosyltransferase involved in cell wall biosynthesis
MSIYDRREFSSCWIIIPAYNEGIIISQVLNSLCSYPYRIVIVDDGSTDDTVQQATRYPVAVLQHVVNLGQGAALQTGIEYALQFEDTEYIVTFDADGQHSVEDIERLLEVLQHNFDVVLGSRFLYKDQVFNLPRFRKFVLKLAVLFTRWTTGLKVSDTHNGIRAFRANAIRSLDIKQNRMAHASEILSFIAKNKLRYCEVQVKILYTDYSLQKGQSIWNSINILWEIISEKLR